MSKLTVEQLNAICVLLDIPELDVVLAKDDDSAEVDLVADYFDHYVAQVPDTMAAHRKLAHAITMTSPLVFAKLLDAMLKELVPAQAVDASIVPGTAPISAATAPVITTAPTTPFATRTVASHGGELIKMTCNLKNFIF